jgi:hypothetical protein
MRKGSGQGSNKRSGQGAGLQSLVLAAVVVAVAAFWLVLAFSYRTSVHVELMQERVAQQERRVRDAALKAVLSGAAGRAGGVPERAAIYATHDADGRDVAAMEDGRFPVVLNEVLALNGSTNFDEHGDTSDWVELFNRGSRPVDLGGYYLSDDPAEPRKWTFPSLSIGPQEYLLVFLSGRGWHARPSEEVLAEPEALTFAEVFIAPGDTWRYLIATEDAGPPPAWNQPAFDDSAFALGPSGFGYGDGDDATLVPPDTGAIFCRREFHLEDPTRVLQLVLRVAYDDGFVAYLNGVRVAAGNAPEGSPDFSSLAARKHDADDLECFDLTSFAGSLRAGRNVLAVVGLNTRPSTDMSLVVELGSTAGLYHASFRLNGDGEVLSFRSPRGEELDSIALPPQARDESYGRVPGEERWGHFLTPTPLGANVGRPYRQPVEGRVTLEPPPGVYPAAGVRAQLVGNRSDLEIHYTADGTEPHPNCASARGGVRIDRDTTIRAAGFLQGERATPVVTGTYLLGLRSALPVWCLSVREGEFRAVYEDSRGRGREAECRADLEVFDGEGGSRILATGLGLRLHGGAGRRVPVGTKKSYRAYFRKSYGDASLANRRVIADTRVEAFDKLVLRAGYNDRFRPHRGYYNQGAGYIRDQVMRDLHRDMGALAGHGSWSLLRINGEDHGLYNVVERLDERFLAAYSGEKEWDVVKTEDDVLVGTRAQWDALAGLIATTDLGTDEGYRRVLASVDLENFTGYMILNLWGQNWDWPHNNWYAARPRRPGGKWIFLSWDAEWALGLNPEGVSNDSFDFLFRRGRKAGTIGQLFLALVAQSATYRSYFRSEVARHLAGALRPANVLRHVDRQEALVAPAMEAEIATFAPGYSFGSWQRNIDSMRAFARERGEHFVRHVEQHLGGDGQIELPAETGLRFEYGE